MYRLKFVPLMLMFACTGESSLGPGTTDDTSVDTGDDTDTGFASSYGEGKYILTELMVNDDNNGIDLTGDGIPENNLPNALKIIDAAMPAFALSQTDINERLAANLLNKEIIYLMQAKNYDQTLFVDWLPGIERANKTIEPSSEAYHADGQPKSRLTGVFTSEKGYLVGPSTIQLEMEFVPTQPAFTVPLENARIEGTIDAMNASGILGGAIPIDVLIDDVIDPLIPEEGVDTNGDGQPNISKEALMATVRLLGENPNVADLDLGDGRMGVSSGFSFVAVPTDW